MIFYNLKKTVKFYGLRITGEDRVNSNVPQWEMGSVVC